MSKDKKEKKKKEKIVYIDDGRSLADMSGVRGGKSNGAKGSLLDQGKTFLGAMRMMFVPMLVTMGIIAIAFLVVRLLLMLAV